MRHLLPLAAALSMFATYSTGAAEPDGPGVEFFEKRIRPALVEHCYACHSQEAKKNSSKKLKGGLLLDNPADILKGGDSGPTVVPGETKKSLLLQALRQEDDLRMPPKGKLSEAVIADFVRWVEMGAP